MPSLPGLEADVYYGKPDKVLPDWRAEAEPPDAEEKPLSNKERRALIGVLGIDPAELWSE